MDHERKCHDCGNVAVHQDNITPEVLCKKCRSQDTRVVRKPPPPPDLTPRVGDVWGHPEQTETWRRIEETWHTGEVAYTKFGGDRGGFMQSRAEWQAFVSSPDCRKIN